MHMHMHMHMHMCMYVTWQYMDAFNMYVTWQYMDAFNQPLSFDTSSVTDISEMFTVRAARASSPPPPCPIESSACTLHRPTPSPIPLTPACRPHKLACDSSRATMRSTSR